MKSGSTVDCKAQMPLSALTAGAARTMRATAAGLCCKAVLSLLGMNGVAAVPGAPPPPDLHSGLAGGSPSSLSKLLYNLRDFKESGMTASGSCFP